LPGEFSVTISGSGGTVAPSPVTTTSRVAHSVFSAGNTAGPASASATVDNGTATIPLKIQAPVVNADVSVSKSGPTTITADTGVTYTIVVTNGGPANAASVSLSDTLPSDETFVSLTQTSGPTFTCSTGSTINCTIATLSNGSSADFSLVAHLSANATPGSTVSNTATVSTTSTDPTSNNNSSTTQATVEANTSGGGSGGGPVPPSATPELDSLVLFGAGSAGLGLLGRLQLMRGRKREDDE
jgi:uncharacterized repeat protein (TIGR01451 family)